MARSSNPALAREAATRIVRTLRAAGHTAYFAGGCVRDELLGLHPTDYDVATDATPPVVRSLFRSTDEVGASFGVVLVHERTRDERATVEVATFRSDGPYTDSRRPDTVRFSDPRSDAARRDFTINAIFLDPLADPAAPDRIIDYVAGLADLRAGVIRAVGIPDQRLAEDHLRALRAVRFAARLGFEIEPATADAIRRHASELRGVSRERIGEELRAMLAHPRRARAVALLQRLTLDAPVLNEQTRDGPLTTLVSLGEAPASPMLALAAWQLDRAGGGPGSRAAATTGLGDEAIAQARQRLRAALCLSNDEADELHASLLGHQHLVRAWSAAAVARRKRWAAAPWFDHSRRLMGPDHPDLLAQIDIDLDKMRTDGVGITPPPLLTGDDLAAAGMTPGPIFRRILESVYDAQLEGRITSRAQAMELAATMYV